eukprot:6828626-Prymnesium_polylepis.1
MRGRSTRRTSAAAAERARSLCAARASPSRRRVRGAAAEAHVRRVVVDSIGGARDYSWRSRRLVAARTSADRLVEEM